MFSLLGTRTALHRNPARTAATTADRAQATATPTRARQRQRRGIPSPRGARGGAGWGGGGACRAAAAYPGGGRPTGGSGAPSATDALIVLQAAAAEEPVEACATCDACPSIAQFALFAGVRGACATTGLDPALGNCRCADDNRKVCFTPHQANEATCGGSTCECYFGPPLPLSSANTPTCVLNRVASAPSRQADVDQGSGTIVFALDEIVHLGETITDPCPYCDGDPTPGDGVRAGTCVGGEDDGASCDAQSGNTTFPVPTGNAAVNTVAGLPGPGRLAYQALLSLPCTSDPSASYTPGVGGCP